LNDIKSFLTAQQSKLLTHADQVVSGTANKSTLLEFVYSVLDEWSDFAAGRNLQQPDRKERTFWYALYTLEEIAEFPVLATPDPFMELITDNLVRVAVVLSNWGELPMEFFATRPGEEPDLDLEWDEDLLNYDDAELLDHGLIH
jgi:hypothetical protein